MKRLKLQKLLTLFASLLFYGWWDWRFLALMVLSASIDYYCALQIYRTTNNKKWVYVSIISNLSILGFFKYLNFFAESTIKLLGSFGVEANFNYLQIILPLGISFYTFQVMSYVIDVYKKEAKPILRYTDFLLFVSYFPQLVAGPIERAADLAPQLLNKKNIYLKNIISGLELIAWGYVKKTVFADNLAPFVDTYYDGNPHSILNLVLATYAFTFQIYGDFSGYTDIARGLSQIMGVNLRLNFKNPYFAINPSEFWTRWHISLSSWLKSYVYIPLGGNRGRVFKIYRNLMLTMVLGGIWHGASFTFILWGVYHGLLLIIFRYFKLFQDKKNLFNIFIFFHLTVFGWFLFRVKDYSNLIDIVSNIQFSWYIEPILLTICICIITPFIIIDYIQYKWSEFSIARPANIYLRLSSLVLLAYIIWIFHATAKQRFIYFDF